MKKLLFLAAIMVALFLYSFHIADDLYGDELGHTYHVIAAGNFWDNIRDPSMCYPPLYFMFAKYSYDLAGMPWAMRIPSLIFALGTIVLVAFVARRMLGEEYFVPAALISALSPFLLEFAAEGRAYAMLIFFSVATLWAFYEFIKKESIKTMLLLSATIICGALTHYFFWFQAGFIGLYYIFKKKTITRYSAGVCLITAALLAPFVVILFFIQKAQFSNYLQVDFAGAYFSVVNFLARLYIAISYGFSTFTLPNLDPARNVPIIEVIKNNIVLFALVVVAFGGFLMAWIRLAKEKSSLFWFFVLGIIIPVIAGLVATKAELFLVREKHLAIIWAPYILLVVLSFGYLKERKWGWAVMGAYLCIVMVSIYHFTAMPNEYTRRMDWTGLNKALEQKIAGDDIAIYYFMDPQQLSLGKMIALDRVSKVVNMEAERTKHQKVSARDMAKKLNEKTAGNIFIINNETDRNIVDPGNDIYNTLKEVRIVTAERFGRNLILYVFSKKDSGRKE